MAKILSIIVATMLLVSLGAAYLESNDPRRAYAVPYLAPDPSLKTTDPFYLDQSYNMPLPPIFDKNVDLKTLLPDIINTTEDDEWMYLDTRGKMMTSHLKIRARSSYELTENEMKRANITLGDENWL